MKAPKRFFVKLFASNPEVVDAEEFVPVFQRWIQENFAPDELIIDVADYKHVPQGPGIILIGHDGDYAYDFVHGKVGLQYTFKQVKVETLEEAVSIALKRVVTAIEKAEAEEALNGITFDKTKVQITFLDRLNYPNDEETAKATGEALTPLAKSTLGGGVTVDLTQSDPREPLTIVFQGEPISLNTLATA